MKHDLDYMLQVMQAAKEGKTIEEMCNDGEVWFTIAYPKLHRYNWEEFSYRIKPEPPKPEYVPYESAEEFLIDQKIHGPYFTDKLGNDYYLPSNIYSNKDNIGVCGAGYCFHCTTLCAGYIWQDGTPCGKLNE